MSFQAWNLPPCNDVLFRHPANAASNEDRKADEYSKYFPTGCRILRSTSEEAPYWQIQYYPEHLTSEPSVKCPGTSSFAQTLRGIDEAFYEMFPDARHPTTRQWSAGPNTDNAFFGETAFYMQGESIAFAHSPQQGICFENSPPQAASDDTVHVSSVEPPGGFSSELMGAIQPSKSTRKNSAQPVQSWVVESDGSTQQHLIDTEYQTSIAMPVPSRRMSSDSETDRVMDIYESTTPPVDGNRPIMACLSPPPREPFSSELRSFSPSSDTTMDGMSTASTPVNVKQEFSPTQDLNRLPLQTGTWPSLRTRSHSQTESSPLPDADMRGSSESATTPTSLTSFGSRAVSSHIPACPSTTSSNITSPSSPMEQSSPAPSRSEPEISGPPVMRLSPLPANRRPVEKKKTQTLALSTTFSRVCFPNRESPRDAEKEDSNGPSKYDDWHPRSCQ
ncbi:hypothetical protein K435DRAFT_126577 [Dendrothele bispora CBS 962.96]|uniref:Uncharacterized protein n=1 Tax=Dendrothele bispora (strain CBS 962.96) TaxID=1314807 RepID=A0A4S8M0D8_DENBC|nr:hypothetical protein K435DRAFT_126577 [Dendrothele bispora CBS 962.96]